MFCKICYSKNVLQPLRALLRFIDSMQYIPVVCLRKYHAYTMNTHTVQHTAYPNIVLRIDLLKMTFSKYDTSHNCQLYLNVFQNTSIQLAKYYSEYMHKCGDKQTCYQDIAIFTALQMQNTYTVFVAICFAQYIFSIA